VLTLNCGVLGQFHRPCSHLNLSQGHHTGNKLYQEKWEEACLPTPIPVGIYLTYSSSTKVCAVVSRTIPILDELRSQFLTQPCRYHRLNMESKAQLSYLNQYSRYVYGLNSFPPLFAEINYSSREGLTLHDGMSLRTAGYRVVF
jgi:hypothetical protein